MTTRIVARALSAFAVLGFIAVTAGPALADGGVTLAANRIIRSSGQTYPGYSGVDWTITVADNNGYHGLNVFVGCKRADGTTYEASGVPGPANFGGNHLFGSSESGTIVCQESTTDLAVSITVKTASTTDGGTPPDTVVAGQTWPEFSCGITDLTANANGTRVFFSWHYTSSTMPTGGFDLWLPSPGLSTDPTSTPETGTLHATAGQPGWFEAWVDHSLPMVTQARVGLHLDNTCFVDAAVTLPSPAPQPDGGSTGSAGGSDPDNGGDCGWNPFCYIKAALKWAFVPSSASSDAWSNMVNTAKTRFPISIVVGGVDWLYAVFQDMTGAPDCTDSTAINVSQCPNSVLTVQLGPQAGAPTFGFFDKVGDMMQNSDPSIDTRWMHAAFLLMCIGVWVPTMIDVWNRISRSFGDKA